MKSNKKVFILSILSLLYLNEISAFKMPSTKNPNTEKGLLRPIVMVPPVVPQGLKKLPDIFDKINESVSTIAKSSKEAGKLEESKVIEDVKNKIKKVNQAFIDLKSKVKSGTVSQDLGNLLNSIKEVRNSIYQAAAKVSSKEHKEFFDNIAKHVSELHNALVKSMAQSSTKAQPSGKSKGASIWSTAIEGFRAAVNEEAKKLK